VTVALSGTGASVGPAITNLVVNDMGTTGNDTIPNNTQWSIQSNFQVNVTPNLQMFGDRTFTINPTGSSTILNGKPWIRTAADSKLFTGNPVATFKLTGTKVDIVVDDRHNNGTTRPTFLDTTWTDTGANLAISENGTARTYSIWQKTFPTGSTISLPPVTLNFPFYFVVVE
jgi:hypothetical protein